MKKSLILGLTALLAVSLTFFSCNNANQNDPTGNTPTTDEPTDKVINKELTFTCEKSSWGASGSVQIDLPEEITVAEGDIVVISGTFEFGTPSAGKVVQFYPQDCIGWQAPDYNWIASYDAGLNGSTVTRENAEWTIAAKSAGTWSKIQWGLGWEDKDENANATCTVNLKNVTITKK